MQETRFFVRAADILLKSIAIAMCLGMALPATSQGLTQEQITASYLYNFAKNTQWPDDDVSDTFNILLFRTNEKELYEALIHLKNNVKIHGKPINISRAKSTNSLEKFHMIFTKSEKPGIIDEIYNEIDGRPILLVTWNFNNKQLVMINLTPTQDRLLKFEVNKSNIINQGLKPHPEIILNGGTEIDVAKLYREGQASLIRLKKQLDLRGSMLVELSNEISTQEKYNDDLEIKLKTLNDAIVQSNQLIQSQNLQLNAQKKEIDAGLALRQELSVEVEQRSKALFESRERLSTIQEVIALRESKLNSLNQKISSQKLEIDSQKDTISELDELVNTQTRALSYLRILIVLAILLILSIFLAYKTKRKDNARLFAKGQALEMATTRLSIAKQKAEQANRAKGEFLSLMSHELRTPLQSIIGYTDIIMEELRADGEERHIDDLQRVIKNSERLLRLINDVLDLAKNESGNMKLTLVDTKISTLVDEALDSVRPHIEQSGNTLITDISEITKPASIDPEKLLQIMINLLSNATKFCKDGEIRLLVTHELRKVSIQVTDTGIGMENDEQAIIFEKFCQADSSTTRRFQGSGLGLTIVRQFCELMNGSIRVESKKHEGASFFVTIPLPIEVQQAKIQISHPNTNNELNKDLHTATKADSENSIAVEM